LRTKSPSNPKEVSSIESLKDKTPREGRKMSSRGL
jgi:hypothetical protein